VYENSTITSNVTVNTYLRTQKIPISEITESITFVTDEDGNTIARPALLYASNENTEMRFRVAAPDGTCVIGGSAECLVKDSTATNRGGLTSVLIDGEIFRVRYSGADNALERFSITSLESLVGNWKVELVPEEGIIPSAGAESETMLTVKYRAERGNFVRVTAE
jgi:hypothetical protein